MGSNENTWNVVAKFAIDQMLERNENGNLYPLTSTEITVLSDIREMLNPDEDQTPEKEESKQPIKKPTKTPAKEPKKEGDKFKGLESEDLT